MAESSNLLSGQSQVIASNTNSNPNSQRMEEIRYGDFLHLCYNDKDLIDFLCKLNVMKGNHTCPKCQHECSLDKNQIFRCRKTITICRNQKKKIKKRCTYTASIRNGTWFSKSQLSIAHICKFTCYFLLMPPPRHIFLAEELHMSSQTVVQWQSYCREVCVQWALENSEQLGGDNKIVEIYEVKIGKEKYDQSLIIDSEWIFGAIERETHNIFLVQIPNRTKETLLAFVKDWIHPNTRIMSDCLMAYDCLTEYDYKSLNVYHSINFMQPDTGASVSRDALNNITRFGARHDHLEKYMAEFLFKKTYAFKFRISKFFKQISISH